MFSLVISCFRRILISSIFRKNFRVIFTVVISLIILLILILLINFLTIPRTFSAHSPNHCNTTNVREKKRKRYFTKTAAHSLHQSGDHQLPGLWDHSPEWFAIILLVFLSLHFIVIACKAIKVIWRCFKNTSLFLHTIL